MDAGQLVSDDVMIGIVQERLERDDARRGFVLDGFPRTVDQATALDQMMTGRGPLVVLDVVVPEDVLVRRLATRRICGSCGGNAAVQWTAACEKCGGALVHAGGRRRRDRAGAPEGVPAAEQPLVDYYSARPTFRAIDGNQPADVVTAAVDAAIDAAAAGGRRRAVIVCKSPREIEQMRRANVLVADVLAELAAMVEPGVTTADLDAAAERLVRAAGAEPAFKGYRGYPATLCASVNDEVVHGIPAKPRARGGRHHLARHGREAGRVLR